MRWPSYNWIPQKLEIWCIWYFSLNFTMRTNKISNSFLWVIFLKKLDNFYDLILVFILHFHRTSSMNIFPWCKFTIYKCFKVWKKTIFAILSLILKIIPSFWVFFFWITYVEKLFFIKLDCGFSTFLIILKSTKICNFWRKLYG